MPTNQIGFVMKTNPTPNNSLPTQSAEEPKTKPTGNLSLKSQLVNPAWAEEVAASFNLNGSLAKAVALALAKEIASEKAVIRLASRSSLAKRVRAAVNTSIV